MIKTVSIKPAASPFHDENGYGGAMAQVVLIRAGRLDRIDWEGVAEEIKNAEKSGRGEVESALRVLLKQTPKQQFQLERCAKSWALSIANQRQRYGDGMEENLSLKPKLDEMRKRAYPWARIDAAQEAEYPLQTFPVEPSEWAVLLEDELEFSLN
jgi:hypothetical protein